MIFRNMTCEELGDVLEWAASEGWNPGYDDANAFFSADPAGFFVAELEGRLAAAISVINHSDSFAFLGLYICHPDFRGRGIGLALWNHALEHAGTRTVGLDGVPAQQENYRLSGFVWAGENQRFEGKVPPIPNDALRPVSATEVPALTRRSANQYGYAMDRFLGAWLTDTGSRRTVVQETDNRVTGFATFRRCLRGYKIGPLIADTPEAALAILHGIAALVSEEDLVIDIPAEMTTLVEHCRTLGMECSFTTARMYRGTPPRVGEGIGTIATLELG